MTELTVGQALQQGIAAHREGKLQEAERLYRIILEIQPQHPDANHNLGVIAVAVGKINLALPLFKKALETSSEVEQFWFSYIETLIKEKQFEEAVSILNEGKSRELDKIKLEALHAQLTVARQLDVLELSDDDHYLATPPESELKELLLYYQNGRYDEAERLASSITKRFPEHQFSWKVLGAVLGQRGRRTDAMHAHRKAVELSPADVESRNNLGMILRELGRLSEAEKNLRQAIVLKPDYVQAHSNFAFTLKELAKLIEAEASYRKAITLKCDFVLAHNNLSATLKELGRLKEAEASSRKAIILSPESALAYNTMGAIFKEFGSLKEAESSSRKAIILKTDFALAHRNLAVTFKAMGRLEDTEASYRRTIYVDRYYYEAYVDLSKCLIELGKMDEAEAILRQVIALKPGFADAFWCLYGTAKTIDVAEYWIDRCLTASAGDERFRTTKSALRFYQGDGADFDVLMQSEFKQHSYMRSFSWAFNLPNLPELYFNKWYFFDAIFKRSVVSRPFYEFGVWRASSFKYLINVFKKGFGFDTFTGLPEDWIVGDRIEKMGTYSSDGNVPEIEGGEFIVGKFEDTLPTFFSEKRPLASVINFDADLYSSTICALNFSKSVIDKDTILIFDEFIINESWEQDEFRALNEFCSVNRYSYEVIAISFFTKQVAVKLIGI